MGTLVIRIPIYIHSHSFPFPRWNFIHIPIPVAICSTNKRLDLSIKISITTACPSHYRAMANNSCYEQICGLRERNNKIRLQVRTMLLVITADDVELLTFTVLQ